MKLYEINQSIRALWNKISDQDGELTEEDIKKFEELEVAKDEKIKAYGVIIKETKGEIDKFKAERDRLDKIIKSIDKKVEWLTDNLQYFMRSNEMKSYDSVEVSIKFRRSKRLDIQANAVLPKEFIKVEEKPDKTAITEFIKQGGFIEGCSLVEKENIQIK